MTKERREKQLQMRCMAASLGLLFVGFIPALVAPIQPVSEATETETEIIRWKEEAETEETVGVTVEDIDKVVVTEPAEPELVSLSEFKLTAYCSCSSCSGPWGTQTATGTTTTEGRTVAVDPTVIPYGTVLIINGHEYVAEDCGSSVKGNHIDIYFESHEVAKEFGIQYAEVFTYGD
jgi:3D (Asp-Asp-Asp) domain-containing protein